jgi:preprotein translocase subunit SecG
MNLLISLLTLALLLISAFVILLVLMQKNSQSGGMGSALGGGLAESAFGSETSNILNKVTIYTSIAFFVIALGLYLLYQKTASDAQLDIDANAIAPMALESPISPEASSDSGIDQGLVTE